ncbi:MAG: DNA topoisomerase VI subunit B [Kiritimatiellae bacterium]|nr:DNA topoisomerase VI subunit B [Kiritimatiellia bacterium]
MAGKKTKETAESMAKKQREISVSEFFLKNRHLLGFDNPRKALLTTVKEAVDNALDACEEASIVPEISVDIKQVGDKRFTVAVQDNGPGILRGQIPRIFAKLLYGSKFHRLRMSRGQQGIGISAAGMYGQLTTGNSTQILSRTKSAKKAHYIHVQLDTSKNKPTILKDEEVDWKPEFFPMKPDGEPGRTVTSRHGTCVAIELEAAYVRGKLSVDEYIKQCAVVNPHLQLYYRVTLSAGGNSVEESVVGVEKESAEKEEKPWITYLRVNKELPEPPIEIKPHPHGVELGLLMQMLKNSTARTIRAALHQDFSRVSTGVALKICEAAGLNPKARPVRIANRESEALYKAISETKLMRPPTNCLSPIGEDQIIAGLKKEISADFYTAVTRAPTVYRGNPFQIEVGLACSRPGENEGVGAEDPVRVMRFANRVPLLYMSGACAMTKAVGAVKWKNYGLSQPRGSLPLGPVVIVVHMASVWVPFTSESKEAVAHYPEIIKETTFCLQECGRRLSGYLRKKHRLAETERKRNYMLLYIPHLALGLKQILDLNDRQEATVVKDLHKLLEHTHLEKC